MLVTVVPSDAVLAGCRRYLPILVHAWGGRCQKADGPWAPEPMGRRGRGRALRGVSNGIAHLHGRRGTWQTSNGITSVSCTEASQADRLKSRV